MRWVRPRKMNYEALGNSVPHLHWWLTPRHTDDPLSLIHISFTSGSVSSRVRNFRIDD